VFVTDSRIENVRLHNNKSIQCFCLRVNCKVNKTQAW
jgi:hypothetical protein